MSANYHTKKCIECGMPLEGNKEVICDLCKMKVKYLNKGKRGADQLSMMWELQNEFQFDILKTEKTQENLNLFGLACIDEIVGAIEETKWKPWHKGQRFSKEKYLTELVDVMHYLIIMAQMKGIRSDEFFDAFVTKQMQNRRKYGKKE